MALTKEDIQNAIRQIADFDEQELPPELLEALGIGRTDQASSRQATNIEDKEGNEALKDFDARPIRMGSSEIRNNKTYGILKEKARALAWRGEYYEASTLLEEVEENGSVDDLGTKLLMAECYLQLGRENRANKCSGHVEKSLASAPFLPSDDLIELADAYIKGSSYVRAIIILKIAFEIVLKGPGTPDGKLFGTFRCYSSLDDIVTAMIKAGGRSRAIAADLGIENMLEMFDKIREIEGCSRDQQVIKEAWCSRYLDHNYHLLEDHRKSLQHLSRSIKNLEEHFTKEEAKRHCIYGITLHNLAVTYCNSQKFDDALSCMQRALEAKELALDYESEPSRLKDIGETKQGLRQVRAAMGGLRKIQFGVSNVKYCVNCKFSHKLKIFSISERSDFVMPCVYPDGSI